MYTTYRWSDKHIHMLRIEQVDKYNFEITTAAGHGSGIGYRIEFVGLEDGTRSLLTQYRTRTRSYEATRRIFRAWCLRARRLGLLNRAAVGDTALCDLMGVRDSKPQDAEKHWLAWCELCQKEHHYVLRPCPGCGVYKIPMIVSANAQARCKAVYLCEVCGKGKS